MQMLPWNCDSFVTNLDSITSDEGITARVFTFDLHFQVIKLRNHQREIDLMAALT